MYLVDLHNCQQDYNFWLGVCVVLLCVMFCCLWLDVCVFFCTVPLRTSTAGNYLMISKNTSICFVHCCNVLLQFRTSSLSYRNCVQHPGAAPLYNVPLLLWLQALDHCALVQCIHSRGSKRCTSSFGFIHWREQAM